MDSERGRTGQGGGPSHAAVGPSTRCVHAGGLVEAGTGAVAPSICLSTTFERDADGGFSRGYTYARSNNPTRALLERGLCEVEGGAGSRAACAAFGSGLAAAAAVHQALRAGDRVVAPLDGYWGTASQLRAMVSRWGIEVVFVDMTDLDATRAAIGSRASVVWVETPSNPLMAVVDVAAVAAMAHAAGAVLVVDNTAFPLIQKPFELGADLVMYSTTKYFGGHSDVLGGAVIAKEAEGFFARVREAQNLGGGVPSPFDCWLTLRGMRTLALRMRAHGEGALALAEALQRHARVERVNYAWLPGHPGHAVARRQMSGGGGLLSFCVRGGRAEAMAVAARLRVATRATSLGGVETLVEHRASIEGAATRCPENLLRVSVGIEDAADVVADFLSALDG